MGKIDETLIKHKRYYLYLVDNPGPESKVFYRIQTGGWSPRFEDAMLWERKEFAIKKAKDLGSYEIKTNERRKEFGMEEARMTFCVGEVTVEINAFDTPEVVIKTYKD